jgi:hypothetical protein
MKHVMRPHEQFFIYSMRKRLRVTAIFTDQAAADAHMERHREQVIVGCFGPFIFLADQHDHGLKD